MRRCGFCSANGTTVHQLCVATPRQPWTAYFAFQTLQHACPAHWCATWRHPCQIRLKRILLSSACFLSTADAAPART
jgi:hypothetical protein